MRRWWLVVVLVLLCVELRLVAAALRLEQAAPEHRGAAATSATSAAWLDDERDYLQLSDAPPSQRLPLPATPLRLIAPPGSWGDHLALTLLESHRAMVRWVLGAAAGWGQKAAISSKAAAAAGDDAAVARPAVTATQPTAADSPWPTATAGSPTLAVWLVAQTMLMACAVGAWACAAVNANVHPGARAIATLTAVLLAVDPTLIGIASLALTDAWAVGLVALATQATFVAACQASRGSAESATRLAQPGGMLALPTVAALSLAGALLAYMRPLGVALGIALVVGYWLVCGGRLGESAAGSPERVARLPQRAAALRAAVAMAALVVLLCPVGLMAYHGLTAGQWRMTSLGGLTLADSLGPQATGRSKQAGLRELAQRHGHHDAWAIDNFWRERTWAYLWQDPMQVVRLIPPKLAATWQPWPNADGYRQGAAAAAVGIWSSALYVAAAMGIASLIAGVSTVCRVEGMGEAVRVDRVEPSTRSALPATTALPTAQAAAGTRLAQRRLLLSLLLVPLVVMVVHSVAVGSLRYRLVAVPALSVLAAVGIMTAVGMIGGVVGPWLGRRCVVHNAGSRDL